MIRLRIFLKISFVSKSEKTLLHALRRFFLRLFKINPKGLISDHLTCSLERLEKLIYIGFDSEDLLGHPWSSQSSELSCYKLILLKYFVLILNIDLIKINQIFNAILY